MTGATTHEDSEPQPTISASDALAVSDPSAVKPDGAIESTSRTLTTSRASSPVAGIVSADDQVPKLDTPDNGVDKMSSAPLAKTSSSERVQAGVSDAGPSGPGPSRSRQSSPSSLKSLKDPIASTEVASPAPEKEAEPAAPDVATLLERLQTQTNLVKSLQAELAQAEERHATLAEEHLFFQTQYQIASNSAVAEVRRVQELEEKLEMVRSQLKVGLKQRDIHYEAVKAKRAAEETKLKGQLHILLEQSRRTDDTVRRKAAAYDRFKEENERLSSQNYDLRTKCSSLAERNEELVEHITTLRARQMGVYDRDEDSGSEGDAEDDLTDASSPPLPPKTDPAGLGYGGSLSHNFAPSQVLRESQLAPVDTVIETRTEGPDGEVIEGGSAYLCKWRDDVGQCELAFDTRAVCRLRPLREAD